MIMHIDNTYIKEYEKDTVINDLCQGKRLNLVVKKYVFSLRSKTQLVFVENV